MNRRNMLFAVGLGAPIAGALVSCGSPATRLAAIRDHPTVTLLDAAIDPEATVVHVTLLVTGGVRYPIHVAIQTRDGTDTDPDLQARAGVAFTATALTLTIAPGEGERRTVAIPLSGQGRAGQWFIMTARARLRGGGVAKSWSRIDFVVGAQTFPVAASPNGLRSPRRDRPTFSPTLSDFQATAEGRSGDQAGWSDQFRHGRTQDGNRELGYYAPGQWAVRNGDLVLRSSRLARPLTVAVDGRQRRFGYLASVLTTRNFFSQQYGYFECEARTPSARGTWAAFWLLPASGGWPPEIDIFEHPRNGQIAAGMTTVAQHWTANGARRSHGGSIRVSDGFLPGFDATTGFHTYAVDWRADVTRWFIDGVEIYRGATHFHRPAYIVLTVAVGGWAKRPDFSRGTTDMHVRRLQVWA